jgi:hypothetical protein
MRRQFLSWIPALALCVGLASAAGAAVTETIEKSFPIEADGRVSVENVNGTIDITGWDRAEVRVRAIMKARSRRDLEELDVEIRDSPGRLRIHTHYGSRRGWWALLFNWFEGDRGSVRYELMVPHGVRLDDVRTVNGSIHIRTTRERIDAMTVNGSMTLEDVGGPLDLSTVNGSIKARVADLGGVCCVGIKSVNGSIRLDLPAETSAELVVKSVNGSIQSDFEAERRTRSFVGRSFRATLGDGETDIAINTVNGSVRLRGRGVFQSAAR